MIQNNNIKKLQNIELLKIISNTLLIFPLQKVFVKHLGYLIQRLSKFLSINMK